MHERDGETGRDGEGRGGTEIEGGSSRSGPSSYFRRRVRSPTWRGRGRRRKYDVVPAQRPARERVQPLP